MHRQHVVSLSLLGAMLWLMGSAQQAKGSVFYDITFGGTQEEFVEASILTSTTTVSSFSSSTSSAVQNLTLGPTSNSTCFLSAGPCLSQSTPESTISTGGLPQYTTYGTFSNGTATVTIEPYMPVLYDISGPLGEVEFTEPYILTSSTTVTSFSSNPSDVESVILDPSTGGLVQTKDNYFPVTPSSFPEFTSVGTFSENGFTVTISTLTPEPASMLLLLTGVGVVGLSAWRRPR